jgi:hypothetical protein
MEMKRRSTAGTFSPDGKRLACGTRIGTILIYDLPEADTKYT